MKSLYKAELLLWLKENGFTPVSGLNGDIITVSYNGYYYDLFMDIRCDLCGAPLVLGVDDESYNATCSNDKCGHIQHI